MPSTATFSFGFSWQILRIGGAGFITGIQIATDGAQFCRADVGGAYFRRSGAFSWQEVVTVNSLPSTYTGLYEFDNSVYSIAIAPGSSNVLYMMFNGNIFSSVNYGASWTLCAFSTISDAGSNTGNQRFYNQKMAVDPANSNVVYAGTPTEGVFRATDGATFAVVSEVGSDASGVGHLIGFDPSSGTTGGKTNNIVVATKGIGIYRSTDAGANWTLLNTTGMPTTFADMTVDQSGNIWLVDDTNGGKGVLNKWNGTAWSQPITGSPSGFNEIRSVAVDPAAATHVFAATTNGYLFISTNTGGAWVGGKAGAGFTLSSPTDPWWATNAVLTGQGTDVGHICFDPSTGTLYSGIGSGVAKCTPPTTNVSFAWTHDVVGIEELVASWIVSPPGGNVVLCAQDFPVWSISDPAAYPAASLPNFGSITFGHQVDYASADPTTLVGILGGDISGVLTSGGTVYTQFAAKPTGVPSIRVGGSIAAASATNFVWVLGNQGGPYFTMDAGATWTGCTTGISQTDLGWNNNGFLNRISVCADRVNSNTFYMANDGSGSSANAGIWKSTNSGQNFTLGQNISLGTSGSFPGGANINLQMRSVPGKAGNLFVTAGNQGSPGRSSTPGNIPFLRSTDGGVTVTSVANVLEVWCFGFGKSRPGGVGYPTIFIYGWVSSVLGYWRSDDNCATWANLGANPLGSFDRPITLEGDNNIYGTVYIGFQGSGFMYGKIQ